jgi:hypothetical protein
MIQGTIGRGRVHQLQVKAGEDEQISAAHLVAEPGYFIWEGTKLRTSKKQYQTICYSAPFYLLSRKHR